MRKSYLLSAGTVILVISAFLWASYQSAGQTDGKTTPGSTANSYLNQPDPEFYTVRTEKRSPVISIEGRLKAENRLELFPEIQGKVLPAAKPFREGKAYQRGEVLIQLDDSEAFLQLQSSRSSFQRLVSALLPDIRLDYPESLADFETWYDRIDPKDALPALPEFKDPQMNRFLASRGVYEQFYKIKSAEERLGRFTIRAPFSGRLSAANIEPGQSVGPQNHLGTFVDATRFVLTAAVEQQQAALISPGSEITVTNRHRSSSWDAVVDRVNPSIQPGTQMVEIYLNVSGDGLREGMYLQGSIRGGAQQPLALIPKSALLRTGHVYVLHNGTIRESAINVVDLEKEMVWVQGLSEGDQIVQQANGSLSGLIIQ